jgi:mannose-6-phosphate isomerase
MPSCISAAERHWCGARDCGDLAEKRCHVPPFRSWPAAGTPRRQRCGGRLCAAAARQFASRRLTDAKIPLVASPYFILERLDLPSQPNWEFHAEHETWRLVVEGVLRVGFMNALVGEAVYLDSESTSITAGSHGLKGLVAYRATEPSRGLLHSRGGQNAGPPISRSSRTPLHQQPMTGSRPHSMEAGL